MVEMDETILIDVDGVLLKEEQAIEGAIQAIDFLNKENINYLVVTNFTRLSRKHLTERFNKAGLDINGKKIFTPVIAAINYIKEAKRNPKCYLIGPESLAEELREAGLEIIREEEPVDFVILGFDTQTNYEMLDKAFQLIKAGAELIGLHAYRQHPSKQKIIMSLGCFVKGLEYCTKKDALVVGKPNPEFFELAVKKAGAKKEKTFMLGDDLESDILGAKKVGLKTILVKTGNFNEKELQKSEQKPDYLIESVKELPKLFTTN